ncbi:MAG TPA: sugar ABC transporter permease [Firmicutes bacterium]|jgi:raffinose/stachyose/melibiose transport system permease protein|nr:sugar ABC transporter permease [Bacillota bacterium]
MKMLRTRKEERRAYLLLVLPAVLLYFAVVAFPMVFSIWMSVSDYSGGQIFGGSTPVKLIGFSNYSRMWNDKYFWISLKNNVFIVLISVFGQIPLGFVLAYAINRGRVRAKGFYQTIIYLPCVISSVIVGILWQTIFSPYGPVTELMQRSIPGWENNLLSNPRTAIIPVLLVMLWMYTGTYFIIFLANLQKIDQQVLEAARIDGATEGQTLRYVILPALSGVIVTSAILAISGSLKSFDLIYAMTGGNPARRTSVLALYMYDTAFRGAPNYPLANAVSTFMMAFSFLLIIITKLVEKRFGGREE